MIDALSAHELKKQRVAEQLRASPDRAVRLGKPTSNLFRDRVESGRLRLDVTDFDAVIRVDEAGWVEAEGMTRYVDLLDATLAEGYMPTVVPELKSITVGGAVSGVGVESSSFKYGLVHESVNAMDVMLADGRTVTCTPENEHRDLFFGMPNSYGTLGYITKLRVGAIPTKRYVALRHHRYTDPVDYFRAIAARCHDDVDFIDGTAFAPNDLYITVGRFADDAPYTSDYSFQRMYYRSIREREIDYLTTRDYVWRWDTDWFWCSKNLYVQNPIVRRIVGKKRLNSITYSKVMRFNAKWGITRIANRLLGQHTESVIQDIDVPIESAPEFLAFFDREIGIRPVWICPIRARDGARTFPLYPVRGDTIYVNFGFWDVVRGREKLPCGYYNRMIERKVRELGGIKSLYSDAYYGRDEFWEIYDRTAYDALKSKYDPQGRLLDLYAKCVERR